MRPDQRPDLELPLAQTQPLIGNIQALDNSKSGLEKQPSRDDEILGALRRRLNDRNEGIIGVTPGRRAGDKKVFSEADRYEPQRLSRKICWQYDQNAQKIPLLRRHYI